MSQIDEIKFYCDALGEEVTIKKYLAELLKTLWNEGECFSGKRPFGNSGWKYDLFEPLVKAGIVKGQFDEDEYLEEFDEEAANQIILEYIDSLAGGRAGTEF